MDLLKKYEELIKDYKFDPLFVKWSFLAAISSVLERKCWYDANALGYIYPNLYVLFVGPPASKKTTTGKLPVDLFLRQMQNGPIISSNRLTPATLIDELKEASQVRCENQTSPLFAFSGEFGVLIKDIGGGSLVDLLLDFFDPRKPGEMWRKNTKKWGKQEFPNPALTFLGCTTSQEIQQSRLADTAGLGFTSRVIFACVPRFVPGCKKFPPLDDQVINDILYEFERMSTIKGDFYMTRGGEAAHGDVIDKVNEWMEGNSGNTIKANYMARKPVQVLKIAMILSAMRDCKKRILSEDIDAAEKLLEETEKTLMDAFGIQIEYKDRGLMHKILEKIPQFGKIEEAKILRGFYDDGQAVPDDGEFNAAVNGLKRMGLIVVGKDKETEELCYWRKKLS